jgi:acyl-CoA synthetase (AMP-forming)/AMP-acid ligase II
VSFLGASIAGTAAPLNPAYPYEEFLFFLKDTNAKFLLCPRGGADDARRKNQPVADAAYFFVQPVDRVAQR